MFPSYVLSIVTSKPAFAKMVRPITRPIDKKIGWQMTCQNHQGAISSILPSAIVIDEIVAKR